MQSSRYKIFPSGQFLANVTDSKTILSLVITDRDLGSHHPLNFALRVDLGKFIR
jgi:hypothetical protein